MPVAGHVGSDYERLRPDFRVIDNPYRAGEPVMVVPAIRPDVALIHAIAASEDGTLLLEHTEDDSLLAQAARVVIASTERVAAIDELRRASEGTILEGIHVTAVVEVPRGAHPTRVRGAYDIDADHLAAYVEAAADEVTFKDYLARYVYGAPDHAAYLAATR